MEEVPDDDEDVEHGIFLDDLQEDSARCGGRIPPTEGRWKTMIMILLV